MGKINEASVVTCYNHKGGVAKTVSVVNLAAVTALAGKMVLIIDLDFQGNASQALDVQGSENEKDVIDFIYNKAEIDEVLKHSEFNIDVLPNNAKYEQPDRYHIQGGYDNNSRSIFFIKDRIKSLISQYDLILIDTNPSHNIWNDMAMTASNYIIIPVNTDSASSDGITKTLKNYIKIKKNYNNNLGLLGVLLTRVKSRTNLAKEKYDSYGDLLKNARLKSVIRDDNNIMDAMSHYMPVYYFNPKTNAGTDYIEAAREMGFISLSDYTTLKKQYSSDKNEFRMTGVEE